MFDLSEALGVMFKAVKLDREEGKGLRAEDPRDYFEWVAGEDAGFEDILWSEALSPSQFVRLYSVEQKESQTALEVQD